MLDFLQSIDEQFFIKINQDWASNSLDALMIALSSSKTFIFLYIWALIAALRKFRKKALIPIVAMLLSFGLADSISSRVFKPAFKRVRPAYEEHLHARFPDGQGHNSFGFVSSHSANSFALYPLIILILVDDPKWRKPLFYLMIFIASAIAYSRVYLGRHYLGDVFCGGILGALIGCGIWTIYKRYFLPKL
jgi:undecaprenyl-diphosphatase